jgi:hypothetical protein
MVSVKSVRRIGAFSVILPALDHFILPPISMMTMPAVMTQLFGAGAIPAIIFFVTLGLFQLIWIGVLLKSNKPPLLVLGVLGNLVSILIYFVSIGGVTLPFGVPPQPFSAFAILIKALEAVFVLASVYVLLKAERSTTS